MPDFNRLVGQKIAASRKKKKLTQSKVSKGTGISRNYISDIENGRYAPSMHTFMLLASFLDMDLSFLTNYDGNTRSKEKTI